MAKKYVHTDYWRSLHERQDLSAVGQSSLTAGLNSWIYRSIGRNLRRFAKRNGLAGGESRRMLEVGVGTGYWVDLWKDLGWRVDGCDLVDAAVERLREQHPGGRFWQSDVSDERGLPANSGGLADDAYDLVTATSILLHVTEPKAFRRALTNLAAVVAPAGHLLLVEPALLIEKRQPPYDPHKTSRMRILRSYVEPLRELGLELVVVEAVTVLAANPLEARSPRRLSAYQWWWRQVARARNHAVLATILGPVMFLGDQILMRTGEAPTAKVLLFRRTGSEVPTVERRPRT
jgi:SAM-dependent methyltransferase